MLFLESFHSCYRYTIFFFITFVIISWVNYFENIFYYILIVIFYFYFILKFSTLFYFKVDLYHSFKILYKIINQYNILNIYYSLLCKKTWILPKNVYLLFVSQLKIINNWIFLQEISSNYKLISFTYFILGSFLGLPIPPIILGASRIAKLFA